MHIKKVTKKDRYGNQVTTEYEVPEKSLDYTELLKKKMELSEPDMEIDIMSMGIPPVMGEEFNMGDPMNHPGEPRGSDTVPAWLTPGEFVVNKEATEMFGPEIEAMNEVGKMAKGGQVQYHEGGAPVRGSAAQIMSGMDPAQIVRMMGNLGNAYQYLAPALGMNTGGAVDDAMDFAGPETLTDAEIAARMAAMRGASPAEEAVPVPGMSVPEPMLDALLHSREGFRDDVYLDSLGKPTVGYGHLLGSEYADQVGTTPFTQDELDSFFREDRETAESAAKRNVGEETWNKLNKRQKATLSSMAFQLGEAGQKKFKNMIKAIQNDDYREAAKQALTGSKGGKSKWLKQTPVRALDLAEAFDPTIAAQYRDAGGVVFDDMPVQYAFLGKLLGSPAEPTPEINWQGNAGMLSELINQGYTPEQAIAAIKNAEAGEEVVPIVGDLAAPPVPTPMEGATVEGEIAKDIALGSPVGSIADPIGSAIGGIDHDLLVEETKKAIAESPETSTVFTPLTGDNFESDIWKIEEDERRAQQSRAGLHVENAQTAADVAASNLETAQAALDATPLTETAKRDALREEIAVHEDELAAATAAIPELQAQQLEDEEDFEIGRVAREIEELDEAIANTTNEEDLAALEAEKAALEGEVPEASEEAAETESKEDAAKAAKDAAIQTMADQMAAGAAGTDWSDAYGGGESAKAQAVTKAEEAMTKDPNWTEKVRGQLTGALGDEIGGALGELFDAGELAKMLVYAGGSMLMGASPMQALNFGLKQYLGGLDKKAAAKAKEQATRTQQAVSMSGKYTPESLAKYQKTGNMADLKPVATAAKAAKPSKLTDMKVHVPGVGLTQVWQTGDGMQYFKTPQGDVRLEGSGAQVYDRSTMGDVAIRDEFSNYASASVGVLNQGIKEGDEGYVAINKQKIGNDANRLFQKTIRSSNMAVNDAQALRGEVGGAVDDYLAAVKAAKETGTDMPTSIEPFFEARMLSIKTGVTKSLLVGSTVANQNKLNNQILNSLRGDGLSKEEANAKYRNIWGGGQAVWATLPDEAQKKYTKIGKEKGASGFTYFLERLVADDPEALKYAEKVGLS